MAYEKLNQEEKEAAYILESVAAKKFNEMITAFQKDPNLGGGGYLIC